MSYRLIDANALAFNYKEVNDMPCIYADLPNGLDSGYYELARGNADNSVSETALFACLVSRIPRHQAFKSWKHSDGSMYDGYFIAGIYTKEGWCTYHCKKEWWPLFDCQEVPSAPVWDGHTPSDAIHRLMSEFLPKQIVNGEVC